ncbi:MAG: ATP-binding cassette domain-containing protein [Bryobacteraceae bacterium]
MIYARIRKHCPERPGAAAFTLDAEFKTAPGVTVLYGPAGAGKTLTLDAIAGSARPDEGRILVDDAILYDGAAGVHLPPQKRNCGYVVRNAALFPHMTLRQNLEFAAERRPRLDRHRRVNETIGRFRLADAAALRPHQLTAAQRQRGAIARALIAEPGALLVDEPARGLEAVARREIHDIIRQVRAEFGISVLVATHDIDECLELGDEMLVLREGRILQSGAPSRLIEQPANIEVARLLGVFNLLPIEIVALDPTRDTSRYRLAGHELSGPYFPGRLLGDRVYLCVRPDQLLALPRNGRPGPNQLPARLLRVIERAESFRLDFEGDISVQLPRQEFERYKHNKEWVVEFPGEGVRVVGSGR